MYEDALFIQALKRLAPFGLVTREQMVEAFWEVCPDLKQAILEHKPEVWPEAQRRVLDEYVPAFVHTVEKAGMRVQK